ncbi:hypothetical protein [Arthrobacter cavernae]|nr:hypothetical protein [Arthrobacter cavernae]
MVELSLAAGYLAGSQGQASGPLVPAGLHPAAGTLGLIWGLSLLLWSLLGLHGGRIRFAAPAAAALAASAAVHLMALAVGMKLHLLDAGHLAAFFLALLALGSAAWLRRQGAGPSGGKAADGDTAATPLHAGALLGAAFAAAVVVSAIATPGLAASFAGQHAFPHGGHMVERAIPGHGH